MMKSMNVLEKIATAVEEADNKDDVASPLAGMLSVLNDMYTKGARDNPEKQIDVFNYVDADLLVVSMACQTIWLSAWQEAKSFEEMKTIIAKKVRILKDDIEGQIAAHEKLHGKTEMKA